MSIKDKEKKKTQLGINYGTASNRLVKDLLFKFAVLAGHEKCFRCGEILLRENFSIEHKIPWLDSADPKKLFFDLENISFSHLSCNFGAARKPNKLSDEDKEKRDARLKAKDRQEMRAKYCPIKRRLKYLNQGN